MNPQPVSLADELRKLAEKWRESADWMTPEDPHGYQSGRIGQFKQCADELSALLAQHAAPLGDVTPRETMLARFSRLFGTDVRWNDGDSDFVKEASEVYNYGFEAAHALRACGHSVGDFRDPNYIPGQPETYTASESCIGCERAAHAAEQPKLTEEQVRMAFDNGNLTWEKGTANLNALLTSPLAPPPRKRGLLIYPHGGNCDFCGEPVFANSGHNCQAPWPVAPGEQPPRTREEILRQWYEANDKSWSAAPPAQERASDELTVDDLSSAFGCSWDADHYDREQLVKQLNLRVKAIRATAAKQSREEAVRWLLYVGGVDHETLADILAENTSAADGDVEVEAEFADLERSVLAAKATLAAQPAPQTKEAK